MQMLGEHGDGQDPKRVLGACLPKGGAQTFDMVGQQGLTAVLQRQREKIGAARHPSPSVAHGHLPW
jgi:hypothetical protein